MLVAVVLLHLLLYGFHLVVLSFAFGVQVAGDQGAAEDGGGGGKEASSTSASADQELPFCHRNISLSQQPDAAGLLRAVVRDLVDLVVVLLRCSPQ